MDAGPKESTGMEDLTEHPTVGVGKLNDGMEHKLVEQDTRLEDHFRGTLQVV